MNAREDAKKARSVASSGIPWRVRNAALLAATTAGSLTQAGSSALESTLGPHQSHELQLTVLAVCVVIVVVVFVVMVYSIISHRKSAGTEQPQFHDNTQVELAWTILPFVILVVMVIPATRTLLALRGGNSEAVLTLTLQQQMEAGQIVYARYCVSCHMPDGEGVAKVFPALNGSAISTGTLDTNLERVISGKQGTAMPGFGGMLSDTELAAVITFQRNAWGNATGDLIQASDIERFRQTR